MHAIKPQTGERVWSFVAAKRAINTGVVVSGNTVFVSHGDENLEGTQLGLLAAIDGSQTGDIKTSKWAVKGLEFSFSSPILDGSRLYQIDGGSTLFAFDVNDGRQLWSHRLGTAQKAPAVFADGKIFVGTDNGQFFIIRPDRHQGRSAERSHPAEQRRRAAAGPKARPNRCSPGLPSRAAASSSSRVTPCMRSARARRRHRRRPRSRQP